MHAYARTDARARAARVLYVLCWYSGAMARIISLMPLPRVPGGTPYARFTALTGVLPTALTPSSAAHIARRRRTDGMGVGGGGVVA